MMFVQNRNLDDQFVFKFDEHPVEQERNDLLSRDHLHRLKGTPKANMAKRQDSRPEAYILMTLGA